MSTVLRCFFFQAEDGIRYLVRSRGLGDVYKRQIIANFMAYRTDLHQVWMVVSPQNPLKPASSLAKDLSLIHI